AVCVQAVAALTAEQKNAMRLYFQAHVFPALTPLAVDPGHPFPHLRNKSLNVAVLLRKNDGRGRRKREVRQSALAVVQVPSVLPRLVPVPSLSGQAYVLLRRLIASYCLDLFRCSTIEPHSPL